MKKIANIGLHTATASLLTGLTLTIWQVVRTYKALDSSEAAGNVSLPLWPMAIAVPIAFTGFLIFIICNCVNSAQIRAKRTLNTENYKG